MGNAFQKAVCISVASTMARAGCETPKKLEAIPASPTKYAHLDCDQLNAAAQRVLVRYVELCGKIDEDSRQDQALGALLAGCECRGVSPARLSRSVTKDIRPASTQ